MYDTPTRGIPIQLFNMVMQDITQASKWGRVLDLYAVLFGRLLMKELVDAKSDLKSLKRKLELEGFDYAIEELDCWVTWYWEAGFDALHPDAKWFWMLTPREQQVKLAEWSDMVLTVKYRRQA